MKRLSAVLAAIALSIGPSSLVRPQAVPPTDRVDCHPEPSGTQAACESRGCFWQTDDSNIDAPSCFYPANTGYSMPHPANTVPIPLTKQSSSVPCPYGKDISPLVLVPESFEDFLTINIFDPQAKSKHPAGVQFPWHNSNLKKAHQLNQQNNDLHFETVYVNDAFSYFKVVRRSNGRVLFDTSIGGLMYSEQFVQISTYTPSHNVYGFGESPHVSLKHDMSRYQTWPMFARDEGPVYDPPNNLNLYGVHGMYLCVEPDGQAHAVVFINTHAQEVTLGPGPSITYRAIGAPLEILIFSGPSPEAAVQQYNVAIGRPYLPAYWSLGFQICRYGYKNTEEVQGVIDRQRAANIPQETQYVDIDYMDGRQDFTYDQVAFAGLPQLIDGLHRNNQKNILILDPGIGADYSSFQRGKDADAFITWFNQSQVPSTNDEYEMTIGTDILLGVVWPDNNTAFPDWFRNGGASTEDWWVSEIKMLHQQLSFDGLWIDMNEPSVFGTNEAYPWYFNDPTHANTTQLYCPKDKWDAPSYLTYTAYARNEDQLSYKTICMGADNGGVEHYHLHNLYGYGESRATRRGIEESTNKRGIVIARSTFPGSGVYAGHWLGDNTSLWPDLRASIIGTLEMNFFGVPYVGADVCGFHGNTTEELCLRWQQLGAFYPMFRNHNDLDNIPQDPAQWPSVAAATRQANAVRLLAVSATGLTSNMIGCMYRLLPYLFSLHAASSLYGGTVARPLFFEFPNDIEALDVQEQFMWGAAILISPVLYEKSDTVRAYFPGVPWYTLAGASDYGSRVTETGWQTLQAPTTSMFPVHIRSGQIVPSQSSAMTTYEARRSNFDMLIAVGQQSNNGDPSFGRASGFLFWDDGESLYTAIEQWNHWHVELNYQHNSQKAVFNMTITERAQDVPLPALKTIEVFGYPYYPRWSTMQLNGMPVPVDYSRSFFDSAKQYLIVVSQQPFTQYQDNNTLSWQHSSNEIECDIV